MKFILGFFLADYQKGLYPTLPDRHFIAMYPTHATYQESVFIFYLMIWKLHLCIEINSSTTSDKTISAFVLNATSIVYVGIVSRCDNHPALCHFEATRKPLIDNIRP